MIGIVDYGVGNVGSLSNALRYLKIPCIHSPDQAKLSDCAGLILPGVGAFRPAMEKLESPQLVSFLREWAGNGLPLLGICLGMQLLLTESEEGGRHKGLALIPGKVVGIRNALRSIHMGWNLVTPKLSNRFVEESSYAYFAHSFVCQPTNPACIIGETTYGSTFPSMIRSENVTGVQFHPEKSRDFGLQILSSFAGEIV